MQFMIKPSFLAIVSLVAFVLGSTVAIIESDIAGISSALTTLNNQISAFPAVNAPPASFLDIHNTAASIVASINDATNDIKGVSPNPMSKKQGKKILAAFQNLQPTMVSALQAYGSKNGAFQLVHATPFLHIPASVKQDIVTLNTATSAFEAALIASFPAKLQSKASKVKSAIDAAFASAIAAYANV